MTNQDRVRSTLSKSGAMCDDCLSMATHIKPRQTINIACRALESRNELRRLKTNCPICRKVKIVNQVTGAKDGNLGEVEQDSAPAPSRYHASSSSDLGFGLALEQLVQQIAEGKIEIYNEFSLQHELGILLRNNADRELVQFERNVSYFGFTKQSFEKREIDIVVYDPSTNELSYAIELKFPRNGQYPEQMFSFCKDIVFMEQVKKAGFARTYVVIFADDALFFQGRPDGIYGYFRGHEMLHGTIEKPTGAKDKTLYIEGSYQVSWLSVKNGMKYTVIEAD